MSPAARFSNPGWLPLVLCAVLFTVAAWSAGARVSPNIDFASSRPVLDLTGSLSPYQAPGSPENDGSRWYLTTVSNQTVRPVTRILLAEQPFDAGFRLLPRRGRAAIRQVATSDADVTVENAHAYGRYAFRITVPPATSAALAIRVDNDDATPRITAWSESAIAAHRAQIEILFAAVAGLIAAALAITAGLAVMTGHAAPRWAALVLLGLLLVQLGSAGMFDAIGVGGVGGPYGIIAMFAGLTLASGFRLADTIAPFETRFPPDVLRWVIIGLVGLSAFAAVGVPAAMLLSELAVIVGTALIAAWLVHEGLAGVRAARVAAPSAAVFAIVTGAAAVSALGGLQSNAAAPGIVGGFAATGAVLLALAIAAGEGIAILPASGATPVPLPDKPRANAASENSEAVAAIGASYQGVFEFDLARELVRLSPEAAALLGLYNGSEVFSAKDWLARVHSDDRAVFREAMERFRAQKGLAFRIEFRAQMENGAWCWFELRATALGHGAAVERYFGLIADVTARKEADAHIPRRGRDSLTGLRTRMSLIEDLEGLGSRLGSATLAVADIDRFKSVHASFGDTGGDSVLCEIAARLIALARGQAEVFRLGGNCFAILFVEAGANALAIGERIVAVLHEPHEWNGRRGFAPASVGVALGREAADAAELIAHAEAGLKKAKREGGATVRLYSPPAPAPRRWDEVELESELRQSLARGEIDLVYQPIVRLADSAVAGFEALLRWNHPERDSVPPSEFIPHAEHTGFVVELGRFALSRATADLAKWQKMFPLSPPLFVSVNVSRRQLRDKNFDRQFAKLIALSGIAPGTLKLELTESAAARAGEDLPEILRRLRGCGASLAIDDFGTGLSTLSQLKDVPFDTVKIDKSFLDGAGPGETEPGVVLRSIVNLSHELGRAVVMEGVETGHDAQRVRELGCEYAQGFYFAEALIRNEVPAFIARHRPDAARESRVAGVGGQP
ncbi:MAG TPA: GGDEF and EAL domain-containing protein [Rhizomicrobium sp.]|nr:GGDEF and EAL domain-containing protein [Rhizomicrobium sp.]